MQFVTNLPANKLLSQHLSRFIARGRNLTIRIRILALFLVIITGALAVVAGTTYYMGKNNLESITRNQLSNSVRTVIDQISLLSGAYTSRQFSDKLGYVLAGEQASFNAAGYEAKIYLVNSSGFEIDRSNVNADATTRSNLPDAFISEALKNKKGNASLTIGGKATIVSYGYILEKDWIYAVAVTESSYLKTIYKLQLVTLLSGILSLIAAFFFSLIGTGGIVKAIKSLNMTVSAADKGDFTVRAKVSHGGPELKVLADNFNVMLTNFESMLGEISVSIEELNNASRELGGIFGTTDESASYMHTITQKMAEDAVNQEESLYKIKESTGRIISTIQNITIQVENAAKASDVMMAAVHEGLNSIGELEMKMTSIEEVSKNTLNLIKVLETRTNDINKFTNTITGISAQTKLLSFNASIEAARAGEFGAGFSVVAKEIQKLAQISAQSASEVSQIVKEIGNDTGAVLEIASLGMNISREGSEITQKTDRAFNTIMEKVSETHEHISHISSNTSVIAENINSFSDSIGNISDMILNTTKNSQEVASTVEDHRNLSSGITISANNLQTMANKLNTLKDKYRTK